MHRFAAVTSNDPHLFSVLRVFISHTDKTRYNEIGRRIIIQYTFDNTRAAAVSVAILTMASRE